MPGFHKRRIKPSPNKNAAKVRRRENDQDRAPLSVLYPTINRLAMELRFFNKEGNPLGEKMVAAGPSDPVELEVACSGLCGDGRMNLVGKIEEMVRNRTSSAQAAGRCPQKLFAGSSESCNHELRARIEITYQPE